MSKKYKFPNNKTIKVQDYNSVDYRELSKKDALGVLLYHMATKPNNSFKTLFDFINKTDESISIYKYNYAKKSLFISEKERQYEDFFEVKFDEDKIYFIENLSFMNELNELLKPYLDSQIKELAKLASSHQIDTFLLESAWPDQDYGVKSQRLMFSVGIENFVEETFFEIMIHLDNLYEKIFAAMADMDKFDSNEFQKKHTESAPFKKQSSKEISAEEMLQISIEAARAREREEIKNKVKLEKAEEYANALMHKIRDTAEDGRFEITIRIESPEPINNSFYGIALQRLIELGYNVRQVPFADDINTISVVISWK